MSELLVINSVLNKQYLKNINDSKTKEKVYYINFVEGFDLKLKNKSFVKINSTRLFQLFCKNKIKKIFETIKIKKISDNFWKMKISEFNLADKFWKDFLKKEFIKDIIQQKKIKRVKVVSNIHEYFFNKLLKENLKIELLSTNKNLISKNYFFYKFYFIGIFLIKVINFIKEIKNIILIKLQKKKKSDDYKEIFIANYPDHFNKNQKINYINNNQNFFYFVSLIRNNSNNLKFPTLKNIKKLKAKKNFDFVEREINIYDTIKNYFLSNSNYLEKQVKRDLNSIGIKGYFEQFINFYFRNVELPKLLNYEYGIEKTLRKIDKSKKIHFGYFEFIEGRIISKNLYDNFKNFIGYQHGYIGFFQKIRCLEVLRIINRSFIPKKIFLFQSNFSREFLLSIKKVKFLIKEKKFIRKKNFNFRKKINVLIFSDLHNLKNYDHLLKNLRYDKDINYFFRPHPKNREYYFNFFKNKIQKNVYLDNSKSYQFSIKKNRINFIITSSYTGVLNEVINQYWPILIINFKNQIPNFEINNYIEKKFIVSKLDKIDYKTYFNTKFRNSFIKSFKVQI